ncbi:site-specific integrase [Alginatibacterium sediminis]|uniref:Site-specific integrase n=1 Tax=Alginatibacterium sediminis TaxID=2164068 RepID=A0A420EGX9_9ALTE|nr:site-specific integrase [Alginatibacterium sediminis]RKF19949.1 site-specific integrase [Alginatibacterium sediminis]
MNNSPSYLPLFPHAEHLEFGVAYVNTTVSNLDRSIVDASYSYELAVDYLSENRFNANNFKSIRSELNLLFNWCWFTKGCSIADLDRRLLSQFIEFCNQPPAQLVSHCSYAFFVDNKSNGEVLANPKWRPFVNRQPGTYLRKLNTLKTQLSILSSFFVFLDDLEYMDKNPASVLLRRLNGNNSRIAIDVEVEKSLSPEQWKTLWEYVCRMEQLDPQKHARTRFLFALLYLIYPRVSEISARAGYTPLMSSFTKHRGGDWLFQVPLSKGGKARRIVCPDQLIKELKRYRLSLNLTELPVPEEQHPLFIRHQIGTHGRDAGLIHSQLGITSIQKIVTTTLIDCANSIEGSNPFDAQELRSYSVHSMRHTGISAAIESGVPLSVVMKSAGHSDLSTLSIYTHTSLEQQSSANKVQRLD